MTQQGSATPHTVLLVEGVPIIRRGLKKIIEEAGFNVIDTGDAKAAAKIYREDSTNIALVIADNGTLSQLLKDPGLGLASSIREINTEVPIAIMGVEPVVELSGKVEALQDSRTTVIKKSPFGPAQFQGLLDRMGVEKPAKPERGVGIV